MNDGKDNRNTDEARNGFDASLAAAMRELAGDESPDVGFYRDFDASTPPAAEMFERVSRAAAREEGATGKSAWRQTIEENVSEDRRRARRTKRFRWAAYSSLAAAVVIVLLVTTIYMPGAFLGGGGGAQNAMSVEDSAADAGGAEEAGAADGESPDVLVAEVTPAASPAPQSDYEDIYEALAGSESIGLKDAIAHASENKTNAFSDRIRDTGGADIAVDSGASAESGDASTAEEAPAGGEASGQGSPGAGAPEPEIPAAETPAPEAAATEKSAGAAESAEVPVGVAGTDGSADLASPEFSDTNIQTEGVQEADIVKTDGAYIYTVNDQSVCISEAKDGHPEVVSEIPQKTDEGQVYFEMYINGDTLTIVRQGYGNLKDKAGKKLRPAEDGSIDYPGERYMIDTSVDFYDVSDRENPRKLRSLSQSGRYADSRMIGDKLYLISTYNDFDYAAIDRKDPRTYTPLFAEGATQITAKPDEIYLPERLDYMSYTVVSGIDAPKAKFVSHESLLGENYTVYASQDNLYLSAGKYDYKEKREYGFTITVEKDYTRVTRLSLVDGKVKTEASADVPGNVDDRYSLDEYGGALRVVTTKYEGAYAYEDGYGLTGPEPLIYEEDRPETEYSEEYYDEENQLKDGEDKERAIESRKAEVERKYGKLEWDSSGYGYRTARSTGLYVLDMDLKVLGKVDNLAPDEQVYSCRYMGDVAYFVTFRNTDPLFSVDLSDKERPRVMGKLKIPGFSEYLHPYADGLLFGLGSDADEETGAVGSLKVSMFDNSDPYDVSEKDKLILDGFNYTYAANNPKAVLADARKNIIAFPADSGYVILSYDEGGGFRRVMDVNLDPVGYDDRWRWYGGLRGIFIGDVFYVIAPDSIHSYDMANGFKAIDSVSLGSGARYVDKDSFTLPPGYRYEDIYGDIPVEAYAE
jgi:uncharacterized secreted protein with C-terminal beta-propeller domain